MKASFCLFSLVFVDEFSKFMHKHLMNNANLSRLIDSCQLVDWWNHIDKSIFVLYECWFCYFRSMHQEYV